MHPYISVRFGEIKFHPNIAEMGMGQSHVEEKYHPLENILFCECVCVFVYQAKVKKQNENVRRPKSITKQWLRKEN